VALSLAGQQFPSLSDSMETTEMRVPRTTCAPGLITSLVHADLAPASHACGAERRRVGRSLRKPQNLWWLWACGPDGKRALTFHCK